MSLSVNALKDVLRQYRYSFNSEKDLQDGIEKVLKLEEFEFKREFKLNNTDRPDFMIDGIAIEIKTKGSLAALLRQVHRYAQDNAVSGILVMGSPGWLPRLPPEINGKPLRHLRLIESLL